LDLAFRSIRPGRKLDHDLYAHAAATFLYGEGTGGGENRFDTLRVNGIGREENVRRKQSLSYARRVGEIKTGSQLLRVPAVIYGSVRVDGTHHFHQQISSSSTRRFRRFVKGFVCLRFFPIIIIIIIIIIMSLLRRLHPLLLVLRTRGATLARN
jgi:hypothetical protein